MQTTQQTSIDELVSQARQDFAAGKIRSDAISFFADSIENMTMHLDERQLLHLSCVSRCQQSPLLDQRRVRTELRVAVVGVTAGYKPGERSTLSEVAVSLEKELTFRLSKARDWKGRCELGLDFPAEVGTSYARELDGELFAESEALVQAEKNLAFFQAEKAKYNGLLHPLLWLESSKAVKTAEQAVRLCSIRYRDARAEAVSPVNDAKRHELVQARNDKAKSDETNRRYLKQIIGGCGELEVLLNKFLRKAEPAVTSAKSGDWFARQSMDAFVQMAEGVLACNFRDAEIICDQLSFRQIPDDDFLKSLTHDAQRLLTQARADMGGHAAVVGYPTIITPTVELTCKGLVAPIPLRLSAAPNTAERWQMLGNRLCNPRSFALQPLWVYFWAMFAAGQQLAHAMGRKGSEDFLTGQLCAFIAEQARWGANILPDFGYPTGSGNFIATLGIAGKKPEHEIGADLGILVDVALGDFRVKKLAVFQAKNSFKGKANVWSKKNQLRKLSMIPSHGYYLFYHRQSGLSALPSATVRRASDLTAELTASGPIDQKLTSLRVNTCTDALDFASLVTFGLAQEGTSHGVSYVDIDHALQLMSTNSDALELPKYIQVVTLGQPEEPLLSRLIEYGYKPMHSERLREHRSISRPSHDYGIGD